MRKALLVAVLLLFISGCGKGAGTLYTTWKLDDSQSTELCPVTYSFAQETIDEKLTNMVYMSTKDLNRGNYESNGTEYEYRGTFRLLNDKTRLYQFDFGNRFTSEQTITLDGPKMDVYFSDVKRTCTYNAVK